MVQFVKLNYSASAGCGDKLVFVILTAVTIGDWEITRLYYWPIEGTRYYITD